MESDKLPSDYCRHYDLIAARKLALSKEPASHQRLALQELRNWYQSKPCPGAGGILVLPTGGGKTFTAMRFLSSNPLSDGYKVIWLAHTHHLLEQALESLSPVIPLISEPKSSLHVRVVSGTAGHLPVHTITAEDDIIIGTLQTIQGAFKERHSALESFLQSAGGKLFVVFDEAHHSPAPSYRKLILGLRERYSQMYLLGLTATPLYEDPDKAGWLKKIFPQEIIYEVAPQKLMAENILARPILEEPRTNITADFDEREYQKWLGSNRDIPEEVISKLAENRERNTFIAESYLAGKEKYGKTIIFADRWYQCDFLREYLLKRGIRADVVYSHVETGAGTALLRNKRTKDDNAKILDQFRKNELDVLLNVKMLTEGTDVPGVQSVFVTRQTTSRILMTQMIGRALRRTKFGGTPNAYLVFFTDNWKQTIHWAEYNQLAPGLAEDSGREYGKRPPLQLISIELIRKLARQMDTGMNIERLPFLTLLPVGWYRIDYITADSGSEDTEHVQRLVMVFDNEAERFSKFIDSLKNTNLERFGDENLQLQEVWDDVQRWETEFFPDTVEHLATNLHEDLFDIVRHSAQNGTPPKFFVFEERDLHNLDAIAEEVDKKRISPREIDQLLRAEYNRSDRFWATLYSPYQLFKSQFDGCLNRLLEQQQNGKLSPELPHYRTPEVVPDREPSDEVKRQVKRRDGSRCLCCGFSGGSRYLQVDHMHSYHLGGSNILDNLQTLCRTCNGAKGTLYVNFRDPQTDLRNPLESFPPLIIPTKSDLGDNGIWDLALRRSINLFYRCGAVHDIEIGRRGFTYYHWKIELGVGNNPQWLKPHLEGIIDRVRKEKVEAGFGAPESITVCAPEQESVRSPFGNNIKPDPQQFRQLRQESWTPSKRQILELLPRSYLQEAARYYDLEVEDARSKDSLVNALSRARRASIDDLLADQSMDMLRELCRSLDVQAIGRSKAELILCITGKRSRSETTDQILDEFGS